MSKKKVALIFEMYNMLGSGMLHGVTRYIADHRNWITQYVEFTFESTLPPWLDGWRGDGIIVRDKFGTCCPLALQTGAHVVDLSIVRTPGVQTIHFDTELLIKMGLDCFRERFYRHFGFVGIRNLPFSQERTGAFLRQTNQKGYTLDLEYDGSSDFTSANARELEEWLEALPRPIGIICCYDSIGVKVVEACKHLRFPVPEQVAVLGVNNDKTFCYLADPPLSSLLPNAFEIGYRTCALLDALIDGREFPVSRRYVHPSGIIQRGSTDTLALDDPLMIQAIRAIRQAKNLKISVQDVADQLGMSKRTLERRFQQTFNSSPLDEMNRVRFQRSCDMLKNTNLTVDAIAHRVGFKSKSHFFSTFRSRFGISPGQFRALQSDSAKIEKEEIQEFFSV